MKTISQFAVIKADQQGTLQISVATDELTIRTYYRELEIKELEGAFLLLLLFLLFVHFSSASASSSFCFFTVSCHTLMQTQKASVHKMNPTPQHKSAL
jgi:hypothetical protein